MHLRSRPTGSRGRRAALRALGVVVSLLAVGCGAVALAAPGSGGHAFAAGVKAPTLASPAGGTATQSLPAFSWKPVKGAVTYEFQLSADRRFGSIVNHGSIRTANTYAAVDKLPADGTYYWRVRAINAKSNAGPWSSVRTLIKSWSDKPSLVGPAQGTSVSYPTTPLVLQWSTVPGAHRYLVQLGNDSSLAAPVMSGSTGGTSVAVTSTLSAGTYYWAVTPIDSAGHNGRRSEVGSFNWSWPTATTLSVDDARGGNPVDSSGLPEVLSPQLTWNPIPGAARYQVEINPAADFTPGSKVCCDSNVTSSALSPRDFLPNNVYHWRVRAIDLDGNAGVWNVGPDFRKQFDDGVPPITGLQLRDAEHNPLTPSAATTTASPIVYWNAVDGAATYEVKLAPYGGGICDWAHPKSFTTPNTAWTPVRNDLLGSGGTWCVRVNARSDNDLKNNAVTSDYTPLGGSDGPAFKYQPTTSAGPPAATQDSDYLTMRSGSVIGSQPVFRWHAIAGASSYWIWVARDALFTKTVEKQLTNVPAYAPRSTYADENTHYYWAVMPAGDSAGGGCPCDWHQDNPQFFDKSSTPPTLLSPADDASVSVQPSFHWSSVFGAKTYRLQVAQDPTFSALIEDVTTNSTVYTSSTTYPADVSLYWRVRANTEGDIGLNWSSTGTFRRVLRIPALSPDNPTGGSGLPLISWSLVQGATSYDMHVDQADGRTKDFTFRSSAMTPTAFYGTGVWRWKIRANFPKLPTGEVHGPYSAPQAFTRHIDAPTGTHYVSGRNHMLLSWNPDPAAKSYKVQISDTDSFASTILSANTDLSDYAPLLTQRGFGDGGRLWWRVALVDDGNNTGAWTTRSLILPKRMNISVKGFLRKGTRGVITVKATDVKGHAVKKARIRLKGAGVRGSKRTGKRGTVKFRLRPRRAGAVSLTGAKSGFQRGRATVRVF